MSEIAGASLAGLESAQDASQVGRSDDARRALAAGLAREETGQRGPDCHRAGRGAYHEERRRAQRRARGAQRVGLEGNVRLRRGQGRARRPGRKDHADAVRSAAPLLLDDPAYRGAEGDLVDARAADVAPERDEGRLARAVGHGVRDRRGNPSEGLDVLHQGRAAVEADGRRQGRLRARPSSPAFERLEDGRFLPRDVSILAAAHGDGRDVE